MPRLRLGFQAGLLAAVLLLTLWWGEYPADAAYRLLAAAGQLDGAAVLDTAQPLYVILLSLRNTPLAAIVTTAVGWWALVCGLWRVLQAQGKATFHVLAWSGFLLAIHPAQLSAAGAGASVILALGLWLLIAEEDWQTALLAVGLFGFWLDWTSGVLVGLVLARRLLAERRFMPLTALVTLLGTGLALWETGWAIAGQGLARQILATLSQYRYESDLYWLAVPIMLYGAWHGRRQRHLVLWILWSAVLLLRAQPVGQLAFAAAAVWLCATAALAGEAWLARQRRFSIDGRLPPLALALVGVCLTSALLMSLRFRHQLRPIAQYAAEDQALSYLAGSAPSAERYAASARLAYLLAAPTYVWQGDVALDMMALVNQAPDVLIMPVSLWEREMSNSIWLQQRFQPGQQVASGAGGIAGCGTSSRDRPMPRRPFPPRSGRRLV